MSFIIAKPVGFISGIEVPGILVHMKVLYINLIRIIELYFSENGR